MEHRSRLNQFQFSIKFIFLLFKEIKVFREFMIREMCLMRSTYIYLFLRQGFRTDRNSSVIAAGSKRWLSGVIY